MPEFCRNLLWLLASPRPIYHTQSRDLHRNNAAGGYSDWAIPKYTHSFHQQGSCQPFTSCFHSQAGDMKCWQLRFGQGHLNVAINKHIFQTGLTSAFQPRTHTEITSGPSHGDTHSSPPCSFSPQQLLKGCCCADDLENKREVSSSWRLSLNCGKHHNGFSHCCRDNRWNCRGKYFEIKLAHTAYCMFVVSGVTWW